MQPGNVNLGLGALGIGSSRPQYTLVAKPDGGYDFYRVNYNLGRPVSSTKVTREEYAAAGYQDPTQPQNINIETKTDTGTSGQDTTTQQQPNVNPEQTALEKYMADQAIANAAALESQKSGIKSGIKDLISRAKDIYKGLYGGLESQAAGKKSELESQYGKGVQTLAEEYAQQLPAIGQAYAARGAYDSTWRAGAEQQAQTGYEKQLSELAQSQKESLAKLGQAVTESKAGYAAGEQGLQSILDQLGTTTDLTSLQNLQIQLQNKINELTQAQAGQLTTEQQLSAAAGLGGVSDKFNQASKTIQTIIQGQAPAMLKKSIASQIVSTSDLTDQEKKQLQDQIDAIV